MKIATILLKLIAGLWSFWREKQQKDQGRDDQELEVRRRSSDEAQDAMDAGDDAVARYRRERMHNDISDE